MTLALLAALVVSAVGANIAHAACGNSSTSLNTSCYDPDASTSWWSYPAGSQGHVYLEARWWNGVTEQWVFFDDDSDTDTGSSGSVTAEFDGPCVGGGYNANFRFYSSHWLKGPTWDWVLCTVKTKYRWCDCL
jgi:hypothetical protein